MTEPERGQRRAHSGPPERHSHTRRALELELGGHGQGTIVASPVDPLPTTSTEFRRSRQPRKIEGVKKSPGASPKNAADPVRVARLRRDALRSMSANLAEGIALSHKLLRFTGAAVARGR